MKQEEIIQNGKIKLISAPVFAENLRSYWGLDSPKNKTKDIFITEIRDNTGIASRSNIVRKNNVNENVDKT